MGSRFVFYFNSSEYMSFDTVRRRCILTLVEDPDPTSRFWLLGNSFMRAYYTIHDMESKSIGLAGKFIDLGPQPIIIG